MMLTLCQTLPVLIVLVVAEISTLVPPPENITLSCQNFETSVHWSYRGLLPQPGFRVEIFYSASSPHEAEATQPSYDLTPVIWRDRWSPEEVYYLQITAMNGTEESEPSRSPSITFNRNKMAEVTCQLDFPAVDLTVKDRMVTVSFLNPFHRYRQLSDSKREHDEFSYQVHVENQMEPEEYTCKMEERVCRREFLVLEERQQYCLYLTGDILDNGVNTKDKRAVRIPFNRTQTTCVREMVTETPVSLIIVAVLVMVASVVVIVVAMICCAKATTRTPSTLPKALASMLSDPRDKKVLYLSFEKVSQITGIELATQTTMDNSLLEISLEEEEEKEEGPSHTQTNQMGSEVSPRPPIGRGLVELTAQQRSMESDSETLEGVMGVEEEEEEEEEDMIIHSHYGRRHTEVDMGLGDVVSCYGPV